MSASAYARSMPALGFDPTPGDPASTTRLASRYAEIAAELTQIAAVIGQLSLSGWQGRAGTTARARLAGLAPAIAGSADAATQLSGVAAAWSARLGTYQSESDVLESRAAAEIGLQQSLTAT